ncbi:hypothetical protein [Rhizobium leguminosarum]|uniref:hypothetical protein n=1 Tax=Rhizobium leguminosarum TaxID=384 RepID=UPI003F943CB4
MFDALPLEPFQQAFDDSMRGEVKRLPGFGQRRRLKFSISVQEMKTIFRRGANWSAR